MIDLSSVVTGFTPGQSAPADFIQLAVISRSRGEDEPDEPGFGVSVDFDGGGNNFVEFVRVFGAGSGVGVEQLVGGGAIDLVP